MLAVPPPAPETVGMVETVKTIVLVIFCPTTSLRSLVFGSFSRSCVMVPSAMNLVRSCGSRGVSVRVAVRALNTPTNRLLG